MAWYVDTPGEEFAWTPEDGYSPDVERYLLPEYEFGVPYWSTGTLKIDLGDERTVYFAAKTFAETYYPGNHSVYWTDDEPLPPLVLSEPGQLRAY